MDFELTEELAMIRDMAREFAQQELLPRATKHDRQGFIDPEVFQMMGDLGIWGLTVPEAYGGTEVGNLALSLVLEEINHACASTGVTASVHGSPPSSSRAIRRASRSVRARRRRACVARPRTS